MKSKNGISLKTISHPRHKNRFKRLWNYIYLNYIYKIPDSVLETIKIEIDKD